MGRPSKATEARIEALLAALRAGSTREAAAAHAGIDRTTLFRWLARDAGLRARVEKAETDMEVRCVAGILQAGGEDWRALAWVLERRRPKAFGRAAAIAAAAATVGSGEPPSALPPHPLDDLSPAEQAHRARELAERLAAEAAEQPTLEAGTAAR